ncbi:sulfatase-like hydrolase/transferase [Gluconobacter wancherniae]|uniref:sulfatase-like hydrolase/transferase n=1 Tax=Gluconobacter wancherniae TaxID=1307955 RepID=UPI002012ED0C|nr:sulfatase-like hydrolase/transferase [Gluconobacter wancherniae]
MHMITVLFCITAVVIFLEIIDAFFSVPQQLLVMTQGRKRVLSDRLHAALFRLPVIFLLFGGLLFFLGRFFPAVLLAALTGGLLFFGSRLKYDLLGEPLMFCDAAVIGACIRHPRFYIGAIPPAARVVVLAALGLVGLSIMGLFALDVQSIRAGTGLKIRLAGFIIVVSSWAGLEGLRAIGQARRLLPQADLNDGLLRCGLLATIALGWMRWKEDRVCSLSSWPTLPEQPDGKGPIIVIVQCESFADPQDLGLPDDVSCVLENLARNRGAGAVGTLEVSGFGAYTMRTEYGVLFGHEESTLGFRRFDPYLTARGQVQEALPARLAQICQNRIFVHPHDLKFYGRDDLMPAAGFNQMIGQEAFTETVTSGAHVEDRAVGDYLLELIEGATIAPAGTLLFTVTIENHGPWAGGLPEYLRHLKEGDVLLGRLEQALEKSKREALLVFYGDHRPSLPGLVGPEGAKHTPVVMRGFGNLQDAPCLDGQVLTPAALHHIITEVLQK